MSQPGFWDDSEGSTKIVRQLKAIKSVVEPWEAAVNKYKELREICEILKDEDKEITSDLARNTDSLTEEDKDTQRADLRSEAWLLRSVLWPQPGHQQNGGAG